MARSDIFAFSTVIASFGIFFAPSTAFAGWHVGDPIPTSVASTPDVQITSFSLPVDELQLLPCGGGSIVHQSIDDTITANNGLVIPLGCWEEVSIIQSGDFTVSGYTPTNYALTMSIGTGPIELVMDTNLEIVSGGSSEDVWIDLLAVNWYADELEPYVSSSAAVNVTSAHSRYPYLQDSLGLDSAMHMN